MQRKVSENNKLETLITDGRLATEFKQIQFTGNELLHSQESQKENDLKIKGKISYLDYESITKKNDLSSDDVKRKKSGKDSINSDHKIIKSKNNNFEKNNPSQFQNHIPQLLHMNQYNFANKNRRVSMGQFSFWSVVQIRKILERLKQKYAYANLTGLQYDLIGDKSVQKPKKENLKEKYGYQTQMSNAEKVRFKDLISKIFRKVICYCLKKRLLICLQYIVDFLPVFNPSSSFKLIWDFLISLSLLLFFFISPLHIAVSIPMTQLLNGTFLYISLALVVADILVTINTGYFSKGHIVTNRNMILNYYIKNQIIGDAIATIPFLFTLPSVEYSFIPSIFTLFVFVKVRDFSKILKKIEEQFLLKPTTTNLVELLKLLFVILFVAHLGACVWIFQGQQSTEKTKWYNGDKLDDNWDPQWLDLYIKAYYYNTVTMVTVGYGDIYPVNNYERLLSIATILVACCTFGYIVNSIGNIFKDFFRHSKEVSDNFYAINNYMEKKNISSSLKSKIKEYLDYYWDEERDNLEEKEQKIIKQLPESLKKELKVEANKIVLKDAPIFHENFSKFFNEKICGIIQEQRCHPEQIITKEDEQDDCSIYFIQKGRVEVFIKHVNPEGIFKLCKKNMLLRLFILQKGVQTTKTIMILQKGQYFGTYGFFTGLTTKQSIRSMEFSQFLVIKRSDFIDTLKQFSDDYEKFCMIKDQLMFNSKNSFIEQSCFSCSSKDHVFIDCPTIHYAPDQQKIIKKFNFTSAHHVRKKAKRNFFRYHTLQELVQTYVCGVRYFEQNESFLLDQEWLNSGEEDNSSHSSQSSQDQSSEVINSREELQNASKNQFFNFQNIIPSSNNLKRTSASKSHLDLSRSSKNLGSAHDLRENKHQNQNHEQELLKHIEEIDEVQSALLYRDYNPQFRKKSVDNRDDFNLGDKGPSPIPIIGSQKKRNIFNENQNIQKNVQETQKIKLNSNQQQKPRKLSNEEKQEKNRNMILSFENNFLIDKTNQYNLKKSHTKEHNLLSKDINDVSLGPKIGNSQLEKSKTIDGEKLTRRQSYFNMKIEAKPSLRHIQSTKVDRDSDKGARTPSLSNFQTNQIRQGLFDAILNESIKSDKLKEAQSITKNQNKLSKQTSFSPLELFPGYIYQTEINEQQLNQLELSICKSLPQLDINQDDKKDLQTTNIFNLQRFDDIEGLITELSSPCFQSRNKSNNYESTKSNLDEDVLPITDRNGGETDRQLLRKSLDSSIELKIKNNNNNNKLQSAQNDDKKIQIQVNSKLIYQENKNKNSNESSKIKSQNYPIISPLSAKTHSRKLQGASMGKQENVKFPKDVLESRNLDESPQKIYKIQKAQSFKKISHQRKSIQFNHQTSIEFTNQLSLGMKKSTQLNQFGNSKKSSSAQINQGSSNMMIISNYTNNSGNKNSNTNLHSVNNQQLLDQNLNFKKRKSVLNIINMEKFTGQSLKEKQTSPIDPVHDKALKKEKFWKNIEKYGQNMASNGISSPLILKAKQKLEEKFEGSNSCSNQLSKQNNNKPSYYSPSIQSIGNNLNKNNLSGMDESQRSNSKTKQNKRDVSPTSSVCRIEKKKRTVIIDPNSFQNNQESQGIESIKQLMFNMMNKFEEMKQNQYASNHHQKLNKNPSQLQDSQRLAPQDYIEEQKGYQQAGVGVQPNHMTMSQLVPNLQNLQNLQLFQQNPLLFLNKQRIDDQLVNSNNNYQQENPSQELDLDILKNFIRYFPEYNIQNIQNTLNKISSDKLKQLKKIKIKKAKANNLLINSLDYNREQINLGNICQQFKRKLMNSKFANKSQNTKQEQSEDDAVSDKSNSNSQRKSYCHPVNDNFSQALNQLIRKTSNSMSQQSFNTNLPHYLNQNQMSRNPSQYQNFSKFKN